MSPCSCDQSSAWCRSAVEAASRAVHSVASGPARPVSLPGRVEEEIVRRAGIGAGAGLFADLDRAALASIGIDLDAVRARIDASFGPDALTRADQAVHRTTRRPGPARRRLIHRWTHRDRRLPPVRAVAAPPEGRYQAAEQPAGHIPFTPGAKKCLQNTL